MFRQLGEFTRGPTGGCMENRTYAADWVKNRLKELEMVERKVQAAKHEFSQLAIASRLKSEYDPGVCESDGHSPVECRIQWRQLSNGGLILLELTNRLPGVSLTDWTVLIQLVPLTPASGQTSFPLINSSIDTHSHSLPRLDPGCTVCMEIYSGGEEGRVRVAEPILVRCYLARQFSDPLDTTKRTMMTFCISATVLGANDLVYAGEEASFPMERQLENVERNEDEIECKNFRFCMAKSLLMLMFRGEANIKHQLMEWLFPQVGNWNWPTIAPSNTVQSSALTLSTSATVKCIVQERQETDDVLVTVILTCNGIDIAHLLKLLKLAIWIKIMIAVAHLRKYPVNVALDNSALSKICESLDDAQSDQCFDSKLPFA